MADANNPFETLFDPSRDGTITGFIGRAMGNRSPEQIRGEAVSTAYKKIGELQESGLSPQQAIAKFVQSPEGVNFFYRNPDGVDALQKMILAGKAEEKKVYNLSAGGRLIGADGTEIASNPIQAAPEGPFTLGPGQRRFAPGGKEIASVPPESSVLKPTPQMQNFDYFTQLGNIPKEEIQSLAATQARLMADPTNPDRSTETERAVQQLIAKYNLDPALGAKMLAGAIKVLPQKNSYGQDTGEVTIVDLTEGSSRTIGPKANAPTPTPAGKTGVVEAPKPEPVQLPAEYFGDKADMFLGSGIMPSLAKTVSNVGQQIDSSLITEEGAKATSRKNLVSNLRSALSSMAAAGEGLGVNRRVIEGMLELAPSGSATETPHEAVQRGIQLLQTVQGEIAAEEEKTAREDLPKEEKVNSAKRMEGWRRIERALPTMDQMKNMEEAIRTGKAGAMTLKSTVKSTVDATKRALGTIEKEAGTDKFATMDRNGLIAVDVNKLSPAELVQYKRRIQALRAGAK
jgi:hypothetical protein